MLPSLTGGSFRYEDCGRMPSSQLGLEGCWTDNCVVKEEKTELPAVQTSEGSWSGLSGSKSPLLINQGGHWGSGPVRIKQEKTELPAAQTSKGLWSGLSGSTSSLQVNQEEHWGSGPVRIKQGKLFSETDDASAVLRIKGLDCEGACGPSSPLRPVNGVEAATAVVKGEPDEFVTLRIDDGSCFEPLESLLSLQVQLEGPCKEGPLRHLIEGKILCPFHLCRGESHLCTKEWR
ncbi:uncharacterized protein ISCGN_019548 [Ixodes scapularis]